MSQLRSGRLLGGLNSNARVLATADFRAPLRTSLFLTRGTVAPTFTRATTGTVVDNDGVLRTAMAGEARFTGARRVRNIISASETAVSWVKEAGVSASVTDGFWSVSLPAGSSSSGRLYFATGAANGVNARKLLFHAKMASASAVTVHLRMQGNTTLASLDKDVAMAVTTAPTTFTLTVWTQDANDTGSYAIFWAASPCAITISEIQVEDITGRADQTTPSEYVSAGVLSFPCHGTGVDGVKCFDTTLAGAPIPSATLKGYLSEPARTNHFKVSSAPATQTSASLSTGTYTLWMDGAGSIAVAGATATITGGGTANSSTAITFTVTVAGTVTYTVTGSPTRAQSEDGATRTSYIDVPSTAAVTRNADVLTYPSAGNISDTAGTSYVAFSAQGITGSNQQILARDTNGQFPYVNFFPDRTQLYDGTTQNNATAGPSFVNSTQKSAQSWGDGIKSVSYAGTAIVSSAYDGTQGTGAIAIGCNNTGTEHLGGNIADVCIWTRKLSDAILKRISK